MLKILVFLLPLTVFAGESLRTVDGQAVDGSFPARPHDRPWRVEFYLHDWSDTAAVSPVATSDAIGINFMLYNFGNGDLRLQMYGTWDGGRKVCIMPLKDLAVRAIYVRFQRDPASSQEQCEVWDKDGTRLHSEINSWTSDVAGERNGIRVGANSVSTAFFRVHSSLLPMNSRPPVTSDNTDTLLHWRFDGNLDDSSGHGYHASFSNGLPAYVSTPYQTVAAKIKTSGAPVWNDWVSLRAGHPAQLDGTSSYSQADAGAGVTYAWEEIPDPDNPYRPPLIWDNRNAARPTVTGAIFGTYTFKLTVKDAGGNTSSATLDVGAVATDDNGVVISANPAVEKIFGPMIAFGKNPWGYMDERALTATRLRAEAYNRLGLNPPSWAQAEAGTVSYVFNGVGITGARPTKLCDAVADASVMIITVCDASRLDFSTLPSRILIGSDWGRREEVRICAVNGNTLTVCYDGRGINPGKAPDSKRTAAQAWPPGTQVGQMKVTGTGTSFLSTICPAGAGPSGTVKYSTGSVLLQPASNTATGGNTSWTAANGVVPGYGIRVEALHGGVPFIFYAYIVSVDGEGALTLSRPYPVDADGGNYPYQIIAADVRQPVLHYTRARDGSDAMMGFASNGCESDTALYLYGAHDVSTQNGTVQNAKSYTYTEFPGYTGAFGVNFYGEDLAHRALYYRSGWKPALKAANLISSQYVSSPYLAGGDLGGIPLLYGGGVVGAVAAAVLDNQAKWPDLRGFFEIGARNANLGCNNADTRDSSYLLMFLALGAEFDPDPAQHARWVAALKQAGARDQRCRGADNSWSNGFLFNTSPYPPLQMKHGSPVATGTDLPPSMCLAFASGSITVTRDSAEATGDGFVAGNKIVIVGTRDGAPFTGYYQYKVNSPQSVTLSVLWPGDSGTATYYLEKASSLGYDGDWMTTIGSGSNDPQLQRNWSCTWNHSGQITLDRPWDGPDGTAYLHKGNLAGFGQQPYMLGMKTLQMRYAAQAGDPELARSYGEMAAAAGQWIHDNGFDPLTLGFHYGRDFQACEPVPMPPASPPFRARTPGCNFGLDPASIRASRTLSVEANGALRAYYEANPTQDNKDWGDEVYGAVWGYGPYTNPGVYSDDFYVKDENSNASLGAYKWTGFFFGMGMSHQWPAVRLGGVQPFATVTASIPVNIAGVTGAVRAGIHLTAPSGAQTDVQCAESPCPLTLDRRQGSYWYQVTYFSGSGAALQQDPLRLISPPTARTRR